MATGAGRSIGFVREQDLLPQLFWAADGASLQGQARAVALSRWELLLLVGAAFAGSADGPLWAWLAAVAYLGALLIAVTVAWQNPQRLWYDGRAVAESVKTLVWKYAVRADSYQPPPRKLPDAERLYDIQLANILGEFDTDRVTPGVAEELRTWRAPARHPQITETMERLRDQPLPVRREIYLRERVHSQREWYQAKAIQCRNATRRVGRLAIVLPAAGLLLAVLRALGQFGFDALGAISAVAASISAWAQLRQYRPQAAAYTLAAAELSKVEAQLAAVDLSAPDAEENWARLARDAEDAISREHTTWQARREVRSLDIPS
ncbi:hypothetical protein TR51_31770 [Kitasatospora griseola]|uniref:DUF4231 domain-containing protein n=1 Tax=Kitasatospora griseola TaxID=2064 RepID=A0A0D0PXG6_KITGR|nr:DUF4231 domain-containing protein [Kitasatospora griseola]KIQ63288.1 hypothetical protein TR51_31770 [Kitasatospora griseola]